MARHEYRLVDVFTSHRFGGNPLAVFPHADGIAPADMARIAGELNLSETTFVLPTTARGCDYQVRIFTPRIEMPMAGHPTIGTAWVLDHSPRVTFLEQVGPIVVERRQSDSGSLMWWMSQPLPTWGAHVDRNTAADLLSLPVDDVDQSLPAQVISTGAPFLFVPLRGLAALGNSRLRIDLWKDLGPSIVAHGVFCFTTETSDSACTVRSRMYAPEAGVVEDPATGSASGALGCYLVRHGIVKSGRPAQMMSLQGVEMGRPSNVNIEIEGGADTFTAVRVGGECVAVGGGYIDL